MFVGIIGLGVVGASMAKAIKLKTEHRVLGYDKDNDVNIKAKILKVVDDTLGFDNIAECSVLMLALAPGEALNFLKGHAERLCGCEIIIDLCGVKKCVCDEAFKLGKEYGFTFVGANPMAESVKSGFDASRPTLFDGASMVLTPSYNTSIQALDKLKTLFTRIGFGNIEICTPAEHDKVIALTSQLCRIIGSAYTKSPSAGEHYGISPESYENISKNALLDEKLWTELLFANKENLTKELEQFIENMQAYLIALKNDDMTEVKALLEEGRKRKEYIDSKGSALL